MNICDIYDALRMLGEVNRCLVIAPKRVAASTWPKERDKFDESFGHLKIAAAIGTPEQRKRAVMSRPDILTINYDNIEWLIEGYGDNWPFDMVVADESTRLKGLRIAQLTSKLGNEFTRGQGSVRAKAELGWEPNRSTLPEMIRDAWRWSQNPKY